jgi:hypothetical protein
VNGGSWSFFSPKHHRPAPGGIVELLNCQLLNQSIAQLKANRPGKVI